MMLTYTIKPARHGYIKKLLKIIFFVKNSGYALRKSSTKSSVRFSFINHSLVIWISNDFFQQILKIRQDRPTLFEVYTMGF